MQLAVDFNLIAAPHAKTGRRPFAHTVYGEKSRFLKRRREKSCGSVSLVVLGEYDFTVVTELLPDQLFHPDFFFDPERNGFQEGLNARWDARQVGVQDPIKFKEGFFIKSDQAHLLDTQSVFSQTIINREPGRSEEHTSELQSRFDLVC